MKLVCAKCRKGSFEVTILIQHKGVMYCDGCLDLPPARLAQIMNPDGPAGNRRL